MNVFHNFTVSTIYHDFDATVVYLSRKLGDNKHFTHLLKIFALLPNHCRYRYSYQKLSHNEGSISTGVLPVSVNFYLYINMGTAFQLLDLIKIFKMSAELCIAETSSSSFANRWYALYSMQSVMSFCTLAYSDNVSIFCHGHHNRLIFQYFSETDEFQLTQGWNSNYEIPVFSKMYMNCSQK